MLKVAVIGVGYLGRFHAQKYKHLPTTQLIAVCDRNPQVCDAVAQELGVPAYYDYTDLFTQVDAVSIAATSNQHYDIAKHCLENKIHVLLEKPMTETVAQADHLIQLAETHRVKLQIGHLERFNSVFAAAQPYLNQPLLIESQRIAPFNPRGTDVNVVLDLMIHDIDLIQQMVNSPITHIEAYGMPLFTPLIDVASARLNFANGCVAQLKASRVSHQTQRNMCVFQKDSHLMLDYHARKLMIYQKNSSTKHTQQALSTLNEEFVFPSQDSLLEEITAFVSTIEKNTELAVSGLDGRDALSTAAKITALIQKDLIKNSTHELADLIE